MLFVEFRFLAFLLVAVGVHWGLGSTRARKLWLLACSYAFYAAWDWRFLGLIALSTGVDYVAALRMDRPGSRRRAWLGLSLAVNLGLLGVFKYLDFFVQSAAELLRACGFAAHPTTLRLVLPVGISFYTFQTLSYTIDVYRRELEPRRSLADVALFVAFFPQLVAGPIVRARDFLPQLEAPRHVADVRWRPALALFLVGFVKKACVSDNIAVLVDRFYADPAGYDALGTWTALLFFAAQLYCDFSGYSDMAIACAALLGYSLGLNFAHPFLAPDLRGFWRRWHISLFTWFRDYLFVPLGGSRGTRWRTCRNIVVTFVACGLWHGAGWPFVAWSSLHGLVLSALFLARTRGKGAHDPSTAASPLAHAAGVASTFAFVTLSLTFFRATDMAGALAALHAAFGLGTGDANFGALPVLLFGALTVAHVVAHRRPRMLEPLSNRAFTVVYGIAWALALAFLPLHTEPFIYFQF